MLQLQTKTIDICRISKLLVKYNIKASITDSVITLDGDISDELLTQLCSSVDISAIQNFVNQKSLYVPEKDEKVETVHASPILSHNSSEYDLLYPKVKRGEVYLCDFGEPYGSEQGFKRFAIVIQNDDGNLYSPTTIVIACTAEHKKILPVHFHCTFSSRNMLDYDCARVGSAENVIMAEQIQTVDKTRLRKYIGTLTPDFIKLVERKIDISLDLSRKVKNVPVFQKTTTNTEAPKERRDINMVQVQLLSLIDIKELLKILQNYPTDDVKAQKILELFGFDLNKNGVQYLLKAIIIAPKDNYFNLETLSESISKMEGIDKEEIKRLIIARVKEKFSFRKSPAIDFVRLVNSFLLKQEVLL